MTESGPVPRTSWITLLYYYVAALVGLVVVIVSLIIAANALIDAVFLDIPQSSSIGSDGLFPEFSPFNEDRGDKLVDALRALVSAAIGAPVFLWHIRQAGRAESAPRSM